MPLLNATPPLHLCTHISDQAVIIPNGLSLPHAPPPSPRQGRRLHLGQLASSCCCISRLCNKRPIRLVSKINSDVIHSCCVYTQVLGAVSGYRCNEWEVRQCIDRLLSRWSLVSSGVCAGGRKERIHCGKMGKRDRGLSILFIAHPPGSYCRWL